MYDFVQNYWVRPHIHKADGKRRRAIIHDLIAPVRGAAVLYLACETGGAICHFDKSNYYAGLDLGYALLKQAARKAKAKGFAACTIVEGNAEELLFDRARFHSTLIDTSVHMIPSYGNCIGEAARVSKRADA